MKTKHKTVTLKDIANQTGFSINTVSRVLRNVGDISPKTRSIITQAAFQNGFVLNSRASSLRSGISHNIALIVGDVSNPHFAIIMSEMEHHAQKSNYSSFLLNTYEDEQLEKRAIETAIHQGVDGIILCPTQKSEENIRFLQQSHLPFVLIGRHFAHLPTSHVVCDDIGGSYLATKHLLSLGHRRILMLNAPQYISSAKERYNGYRKAHEEYQVPCDDELYRELPPLLAHNAKSDTSFLQAPLSFTAIFAFSDLLAWQCWRSLQLQGIRVPEDVSIIGFDHIQSRLMLPFSLCSVSSYKSKMSITAVDVLLDLIEHEFDPSKHQITIPTSLAEGESVAPLHQCH